MKTKKEIFDSLNKYLLDKNHVHGKQLDELLDLYLEKEKVFHDLTNAKTLEEIVEKTLLWTAIEFDIQEKWNFTRNYDFHRFWENPHCTCPYLDNKDKWGTSYYVVSGSCPIHKNKEVMNNIELIKNKKYNWENSDLKNEFLQDIFGEETHKKS
jgi:hypothetical protein